MADNSNPPEDKEYNGIQARLPWMLRDRPPVSRQTRTAGYDIPSAMYRLFRNTHNPHLRRILAPGIKRLQAAPGQNIAPQRLYRLLVERGVYQTGPENAALPLRRRRLHHPPPPHTAHPIFSEPARLAGDKAKLPALIDLFFHTVLTRLEENPAAFDEVVAELNLLLAKNRIRVKRYEAYRYLQDWDHLLDTLQELARYPAVETFELFASALLVYHSLVYAP